jgi:hypothetical protein
MKSVVVFETQDDVGLDRVPVGSIIQVLDFNGNNVMFLYDDNTAVSNTTTLQDAFSAGKFKNTEGIASNTDINADLSVAGDTTIGGNTTIAGNATIGDSTSDVHTVNGDVVFNNGVNNLTVNNSFVVDSTATFNGDVEISGNATIGDSSSDVHTVNGDTTFNNSVTIAGNAVVPTPQADNHAATRAYVDSVASSPTGNVGLTTVNSFTASGGSPEVFTVDYIIGSVNVTMNGIELDGVDYSADNGTSISINTQAGDIVRVTAYGGADVYTTTQSDSQIAGACSYTDSVIASCDAVYRDKLTIGTTGGTAYDGGSGQNLASCLDLATSSNTANTLVKRASSGYTSMGSTCFSGSTDVVCIVASSYRPIQACTTGNNGSGITSYAEGVGLVGSAWGDYSYSTGVKGRGDCIGGAGVCGENTGPGYSVKGNTNYNSTSDCNLKFSDHVCVQECLLDNPISNKQFYWEDSNYSGFTKFITPMAQDIERTFDLQPDNTGGKLIPFESVYTGDFKEMTEQEIKEYGEEKYEKEHLEYQEAEKAYYDDPIVKEYQNIYTVDGIAFALANENFQCILDQNERIKTLEEKIKELTDGNN